jgi:hypothetical protein
VASARDCGLIGATACVLKKGKGRVRHQSRRGTPSARAIDGGTDGWRASTQKVKRSAQKQGRPHRRRSSTYTARWATGGHTHGCSCYLGRRLGWEWVAAYASVRLHRAAGLGFHWPVCLDQNGQQRSVWVGAARDAFTEQIQTVHFYCPSDLYLHIP